MDVLTREQRSRCMSRIRSKNTRPELVVRSIVHRLGFRYALHRRDLPGCPDLVLPRHRAVVFIHGCYWHMHACRFGAVIPKTNAVFWQTKRTGNVKRDARNLKSLRRDKWRVLVVWECQTKDLDKLSARLTRFLSPPNK
jgi:DNA mismatch endonuclease (patch repair protein)